VQPPHNWAGKKRKQQRVSKRDFFSEQAVLAFADNLRNELGADAVAIEIIDLRKPPAPSMPPNQSLPGYQAWPLQRRTN
jgi:hypothetical protein